MAEILNIPVRAPVKLDNLEEKKFIKSKNIDLGIVVAYGQILKKDILTLPKFGWINIHYSLLPKLRGAAPIQRAIMNNENLTGISIMKMDEGLDTGPVCNQYPINILDNENSEDLSKRLSNLASEKILENIDNSQSSYAKKIKKEEGKIIWQENNKKIIGKINGLYPNPGGWFEFQGERYKIHKAELSINTGKAGYVLSDNLEIGCGENSIKIIEIQRQGKKVQKTGEFLLGSQIKKGTNLN
jgi:methionyl-tRNA formyltransferase